MQTRCIGLQKIAAQRGMMYAIAERLGISRHAVCQWRHVPPDRLGVVMEMSGLPAEELARNRPLEWRQKINGTPARRARRKRKRRR